MKYILALDTSTVRATIGVATRAGGVHVLIAECARRHGRDLIPQIAAILGEAGLTLGEIEAIGVGTGPGSYTGLRVGVTAAKTLAYATGAVLVSLDTMHAIALSSPPETLDVSVIADAQRGDLYVADFVRERPGAPLVKTRASHIEPISSWAGRLHPAVCMLGPGLDSERIRALLPPGCGTHDPSLNYPHAARLLELARAALAMGCRENPWLLEPLYLRRSAAEDQWELSH
jgi:tRNA threonylcarbamoyladenosine biosynthesis protein TsaB